jgi:hypothetical protein
MKHAFITVRLASPGSVAALPLNFVAGMRFKFPAE